MRWSRSSTSNSREPAHLSGDEMRRKSVTLGEVELFEKVRPQLEGFCHELRELAKKKPDGGINKFKLQIINEKLDEANLLLTGKFKPFKDFGRFDQDSLPTNSDVVLILSQYLECLETWRSAHVIKVDYSWYWNTPGDLRITTGVPKRSHLDEEEEDGEGEDEGEEEG